MIINLKKAFAIYVSYYSRPESNKPCCSILHRVAKGDTCFLQKLENTTSLECSCENYCTFARTVRPGFLD